MLSDHSIQKKKIWLVKKKSSPPTETLQLPRKKWMPFHQEQKSLFYARILFWQFNAAKKTVSIYVYYTERKVNCNRKTRSLNSADFPSSSSLCHSEMWKNGFSAWFALYQWLEVRKDKSFFSGSWITHRRVSNWRHLGTSRGDIYASGLSGAANQDWREFLVGGKKFFSEGKNMRCKQLRLKNGRSLTCFLLHFYRPFCNLSGLCSRRDFSTDEWLVFSIRERES